MRRGVKLAIVNCNCCGFRLLASLRRALGVAAAQTVGMVTKAQNLSRSADKLLAVGSPVGLNGTRDMVLNAILKMTFRDNTNSYAGGECDRRR